jgi:ABC-type transporter Mla MlaB component
MLRIFIHDQVPMTSFVLQGKLIGPWVKELEKYWEWAQRTRAYKTMLVNLADVSFIDSDGRALLTRMQENGARICQPDF